MNLEEIIELGEEIGIDWDEVDFDPDQLLKGYEVELEHGTSDSDTDVTSDDPEMTAKIAWAHLKESPNYYELLGKMESQFTKQAADPSLRPPKKWWDKMYKQIKKDNPDYSEAKTKETIGDIWYHDLTDAKRKEIREREGKEYAPARKGKEEMNRLSKVIAQLKEYTTPEMTTKPTLNSVHGFVYGHYDSRGGTMMLIAKDRDEADKYYDFEVFALDLDVVMEHGGPSTEDFMFEADLYHPGSLPFNDDLEWDLEGYVLVKGVHSSKDWDTIGPEEAEGDFADVSTGTVQLEFVPKGSRPVLFADGWDHPRWDDDAFAFTVVQAMPVDVEIDYTESREEVKKQREKSAKMTNIGFNWDRELSDEEVMEVNEILKKYGAVVDALGSSSIKEFVTVIKSENFPRTLGYAEFFGVDYEDAKLKASEFGKELKSKFPDVEILYS